MPGVAYDEGLATRLREMVGAEPGLAEKKMFGGLAMLLYGNMAVGVHGQGLIVRTDPGQPEQTLAGPRCRSWSYGRWPFVRSGSRARPLGPTPPRTVRRYRRRQGPCGCRNSSEASGLGLRLRT